MEIHDALRPVSFLLGSWAGAGDGSYPTIENFAYTEEVTFAHAGKPFLAYTQRTLDATTGAPLHAESGYLRVVADGGLEFVIVQPSGILEVHCGSVSDGELALSLRSIVTTPAAVEVSDVQRVYRLRADGALEYTVSMAAVGQTMTHHLRAELRQNV